MKREAEKTLALANISKSEAEEAQKPTSASSESDKTN